MCWNPDYSLQNEERSDTYSELSSDCIKSHMDGVLKVRGGGDLRPVLVPVFLPPSCRKRSTCWSPTECM